MTAVYIDPLVGAALVHLGLPILPGLPCPTCGGKRWLRAPAPYDEVLPGRSCPDCTDGVWTPPDHPVTIGVTSARPEVGAHDGYIVCSVIPKGYVPDYEADDDDFYEASGRGLMTNDEWAHKFDDISNHNPPHPIVLSSMIGEGTLRKVKVHDWDHEPEDDPGIWLEGRPGHIIGLVLQDDSLAETDISSALPFLPGLKPGDTVYLLDGFTASVEPIAVPNAPDQPTIWATMSGPGSATNAPGPAHSPSQKRTTR
jgi:hypothetical protein